MIKATRKVRLAFHAPLQYAQRAAPPPTCRIVHCAAAAFHPPRSPHPRPHPQSDGAKLAIKLCKPTADPNNPHLVTLALRELDALRRLDHPRITRLEGVGLAPEYLTAGKHPDSQKAPRSSPPSRPPSTPGTKSPRSMSPRSLIRDAPASYGLVFAIAMEFVEGGSLKQLMVKQMVSPSTRIITWADRLR